MADKKKRNEKNGIVKQIYLILALVGFTVLLVEFGIDTGIQIYPDFIQDEGIISDFQLKALNLFYGAKLTDSYYVSFSTFRFDLLSDYIGYVLIIIGLNKLKERTKVFDLGIWMAVVAMILKLSIFVLPFIFNSSKLCYIVMALGIALLGAQISVGYFFVCGVCDLLSGITFRQDRLAVGLSWFGTVVCQIIVFVTSWLLLAELTFVYNMILLIIYLLYIYFIWKLREFITGEIKIEEK